jgi:hypothetical protein
VAPEACFREKKNKRNEDDAFRMGGGVCGCGNRTDIGLPFSAPNCTCRTLQFV